MRWFDARLFGEVFVTLMVVMDPIGSVPVFLGLTRNRTRRQRRLLAGQAVLVAGAVIAAFALFGQQILVYLGVSVAALQGAGGLLLVLVALQLLTGDQDRPTSEPTASVALVPLGTPLLAGPGAIVATIVFVRRAHGFGAATAIAGGLICVHLVLLAALLFAGGILRIIREGGVLLLTRISGLLLTAIAVQLLADSAIAFAKAA